MTDVARTWHSQWLSHLSFVPPPWLPLRHSVPSRFRPPSTQNPKNLWCLWAGSYLMEFRPLSLSRLEFSPYQRAGLYALCTSSSLSARSSPMTLFLAVTGYSFAVKLFHRQVSLSPPVSSVRELSKYFLLQVALISSDGLQHPPCCHLRWTPTLKSAITSEICERFLYSQCSGK
ncbi:hypothetical protein B0H14DRAFT_992943 [Mycena olivaceomarginata]|nr:hypothetical protein B0H14DRAFT_992943 [Mycena olivaceomarginata]